MLDAILSTKQTQHFIKIITFSCVLFQQLISLHIEAKWIWFTYHNLSGPASSWQLSSIHIKNTEYTTIDICVHARAPRTHGWCERDKWPANRSKLTYTHTHAHTLVQTCANALSAWRADQPRNITLPWGRRRRRAANGSQHAATFRNYDDRIDACRLDWHVRVCVRACVSCNWSDISVRLGHSSLRSRGSCCA